MTSGDGREPNKSSGDKISRRHFVAGGLAAAGSLYLGDTEVFAAPLAVNFPLSELKKQIRGQAVVPGDGDFHKFVFDGLWNKLYQDRQPQVVVKVMDDEDVVNAVKFARAHKLKVAVRGGGHNWCNPSLRNSGMMIDLSNLNQVISLDVAGRKAVVQPIISNREVQKVLNAHNLSYPSGHCPQVKLSGYLLGGGMSWNQGTWGPGTGSVEAVELVTADGELITANREQNSDYFWAARGAGSGFFGIATRYHLKLYPLPAYITASSYTYPYEDCVEIAKWLRQAAREMPSKVELSFWFVSSPPELADHPGVRKGKVCQVTATTFAESEEEARAATKILGQCPLINRCIAKTENEHVNFEKLFDFSGSLWLEGRRNQVAAMYSDSPLEEIAKTVKDHFLEVPSKETVLMYAVFTGADIPAKLPDFAAFSMSAHLYGGPWTMWTEAKDDRSNKQWHEETINLLKPYTCGHYIGETDSVTYRDIPKTAFSSANYARLNELRKKYDPDGLFFSYGEGLD